MVQATGVAGLLVEPGAAGLVGLDIPVRPELVRELPARSTPAVAAVAATRPVSAPVMVAAVRVDTVAPSSGS